MLGVEQFGTGLHRIGFGDWLLNAKSKASKGAIVLAITIIVGAPTTSALSGVRRGTKWLSNLNMVLGLFLLSSLILFGSTWLGRNHPSSLAGRVDDF